MGQSFSYCYLCHLFTSVPKVTTILSLLKNERNISKSIHATFKFSHKKVLQLSWFHKILSFSTITKTRFWILTRTMLVRTTWTCRSGRSNRRTFCTTSSRRSSSTGKAIRYSLRKRWKFVSSICKKLFYQNVLLYCWMNVLIFVKPWLSICYFLLVLTKLKI